MDFYGRAVLVITKFTALQETCSKSSFYYWIWFSRKNRKKSKKNIKGNQLSAFVRFLKNSIVVCFFDRNFWGVIEVSAIFQGLLKNSNATWFLQSEFLSIFKRILQYPFDKNMEFEFFLGQMTSFELLLKCHSLTVSKKCLRLRPAPSKCLSERINWIISTIPHRISKILFVYGSYEFLAMLEGKIREAPFF